MLFQSHINKITFLQKRIVKIANRIANFISRPHNFLRILMLFSLLLAMTITMYTISESKIFKSEKTEKTYQELIGLIGMNNENDDTASNEKLQQLFITLHVLDSGKLGAAREMVKLENIDPSIRNVLKNFIEKQESQELKARNIFVNIFVLIPLILTFTLKIISFYFKKLAKFHEEKSFILITTESEKQYDEYKKSKNTLVFYSFTAIVIAIICGFIGGLILEILKIFCIN